MKKLPGEAKAIAALAIAWAVRVLVFESWHLYEAGYRAFDALYGSVGMRFFMTAWHSIHWPLATAIDLATFAVPAIVLARYVARASVRHGWPDPLERARRRVLARPRLTAALAALPAMAWLASRRLVSGFLVEPFWGITILAALGLAWLAHLGVRALIAPLSGVANDAPADLAPDEIAFAAVAVTRETRAAVIAMGASSLVAIAAVIAVPVQQLWEGNVALGVLAYAAIAAAVALAFQRASRIAVGVDGVRVHGTSRTRFFAYRELDDARIDGFELELVRKGRVVLALQIHGDDVARKDAILARIAAGIAGARDPRAAGAARLVEAKSKGDVARVASGGGDYRAPSITRDQLWALVEGPTTDAATRTSAAEALAVAIDPSERARLRVAASRCAEPRVRVALQGIAEDDEGTRDEERPRTIAAR